MSEDIKDLLSRAFTDEPPLGIDRDEVFRAGRKRLRRKRFFEAGSVVAAVLVAVVGAATLTDLGGTEPAKLPPAASPTDQAPPGPTLPVRPSTTPATESPGAPPARLELNPRTLTKTLYDTGVLTTTDVQATLGTPGAPGFQQSGAEYVYEADVIRPKTTGSLHLTVDYAPGEGLDCGRVPSPYGECVLTDQVEVPMLVARYEAPSGQRGTYMAAVLDNGVRVVATATNLTSYDKRTDPAGRPPALSDDELSALIVKLGTGVR